VAFAVSSGRTTGNCSWSQVAVDVARGESPTILGRHQQVLVEPGKLDGRRFLGGDVKQQQVTTAADSQIRRFEKQVVDPVASILELGEVVRVGGQRLAPGNPLSQVGKDSVWGEALRPSRAVSEVNRVVIAGVKLTNGERVYGRNGDVQRRPLKLLFEHFF